MAPKRTLNAFFTRAGNLFTERGPPTEYSVLYSSMTIENIPTRLADHPTVRKVRSRKTEKPGVIDADWLRQVCLDAGADDVAFASVENPDLAGEREHVDAALPGTQSYISLVVKMNRDNVRSTARSVANQEFHRSGEIMNEAAHRITRALAGRRLSRDQPVDGLPDGDGPVPRPHLGGGAQAGRRRRRPGRDGHPPQRHPPEVRQLHPAGHHPGRRRGQQLR